MAYIIPRRTLRLLEELFQDRQKADFFVEDIEKTFQENEDILKIKIETSLKEDIHELKSEIKEEINGIKIELAKQKKDQNLILILVIIFGLTSNPLISNLILNFIK